MAKRPAVIALALTGQLKSVLSQNHMPDLSEGMCLGMDTDIFFSDSVSTTSRAKAVCAQCPVIELCLGWAAQNADFGVYGGMTAKERRSKFGQIAAQDPTEVSAEFNYILTAALDSIASKFEVDQRTALRWRKILKDYQLAA